MYIVAFITLIWSYLPLIAQIDINLLKLHLCAKFESNLTIIHGDIAFKRIGGYRKCRHECNCSSARRVSNFNTDISLGDIYHPIKLYYDVLGIVYLVIDHFGYVPSDALRLYQILKQLDNWL